MLTYQYTARNASTGQHVKAIVQAESETAAAKLIKQQGLVPLDIKVQGSGGVSKMLQHLNRVKAKDRVLFARQLSTLINAGLPLVQSLRSVNDQTESGLSFPTLLLVWRVAKHFRRLSLNILEFSTLFLLA
jgi:type II secretory pathway component PulF